MKKNILTIVIMASTILNLILTIVMMFSVVPGMNKTNKLIDKVASAIDLEMDAQEQEEAEYTVEDLEAYEIKFDSKQTINLKGVEGDKESHFAMIEGVVVSFNTKADDYDKVSESAKAANVYIIDCVKEALAEQTIATLNEQTVKEVALAKIQEFYGSKCIVRLSLTGFMFQ